MHTLYAQIALGPQQEETYNAETFMFSIINNWMLYFIYIFLGGIIVASLKGELTIELLTIQDDQDIRKRRTSKGRRRRQSQ